MKELDDVTRAIVDTSLRIHRDLGPGLLESVYEAILARALQKRGLRVKRQTPIPVKYDGMVFDEGFRADLVVDNRVIVELKSVELLARVHSKQLLTYLKLSGLGVGLLINFGAPLLKEGLHRIVNRLTRRNGMKELDDVTGAIVDTSLRIHRDLGPGAYIESLADPRAPRLRVNQLPTEH